jgi:hypothetical protein
MGDHGRWRFRDLKLWLRGFVAPCGSSEKALYDKDRPSRVQTRVSRYMIWLARKDMPIDLSDAGKHA